VRTRPTFRKMDVTRAVKGAQAAGVDIHHIQITQEGTISIFANDATKGNASELDKWVEDHAS
jgi:hypothetical protein